MKGLVFTWLLTALGVGGSIISPFYGFLAYVALALLKPDALWSHSIHNGRFSLIVAVAMLLSWALRWFAEGGSVKNLGKAKTVVMLFAGYWVWTVFLALRAPHPELAWKSVEQMGKILLPFLVGITTIRSADDLRKLAWVIVVCQGYVCFEMNMWYFRGYNYLYFIGFAGHDNNSAAIGIVASLGVAFFLFLNTESMVKKAIIGAFMAFTLHAILFSFSRGAMLATIIGVGISFFLIKKSSLHYTMFAAMLLAGIVMAGPEVRARFMRTFEVKHGKREASAQSRLDLWEDCFEVFLRDPYFGCGPDHWPTLAESFGWEKNKEAHSLWVQTATETGLPGIFMYAGFYVWSIWLCARFLMRVPERAPPWYADTCRMTIAALVGFGVAAQFVSVELLELPYYVVLLGVGSIMIYEQHEADGTAYWLTSEESADWRDVADHPSTPTPEGGHGNRPATGPFGEPIGILN